MCIIYIYENLYNKKFLTAVGHLEQVVLAKFLEHTPFDFDELR